MSWCRLDTDVHKIFRCKVSLKCRCQSRCFVILDKNLWTLLWSSTFGMLLLKKNITATEVVLTQLLSYNVSKHKNKNENTEYHGMFISFKSHLYSKQGSPIFLLFESWSLALYLFVWAESKSDFYSSDQKNISCLSYLLGSKKITRKIMLT